MKALYFFLLLLLFFSTAKAQQPDTLSFPDSTTVVFPDSAARDTSAIFTAFKDTTAVDTIVPLTRRPLSPYSTFISRRDILMNDYRNAADLLKHHPAAFTNETGLYGNPEYTYLYGYPLKENVFIPESFYFTSVNSINYDLNLVQTESIDSIEILTLPQSIRYSYDNTPGAVNFIKRDFISPAPYTRIKYFEGPYDESLFDGIFNTLITNKVNLNIDVTNRSASPSFRNTDYSSWQAAGVLKYLWSNKFNISASYAYTQVKQQVNGGVDIDSVLTARNPETLLYDEIKAPVMFNEGGRNVLQHNLELQAFWKPAEEWFTDVKVYSLFNQVEMNNVNFLRDSSFFKYKNNVYGFSLNQTYARSFYNLNLLLAYTDIVNNNEVEWPSFSSSGKLRMDGSVPLVSPSVTLYLADSTIVPSFFYKYAGGDVGKTALGADVSVNLNRLQFYAGYSESDVNAQGPKDFLQLGMSYSEGGFYSRVDFFTSNNSNFLSAEVLYPFWKLLVEADGYYNLENQSKAYPDYNLIAGIFYKDIVFNNNLDLKTGFKFYFSEGLEYPSMDPASFLYAQNNYRLDFTLAGEIRKTAVIYFTWENLTNNNYFLVPFYPVRERNIRFGVAWELFN